MPTGYVSFHRSGLVLITTTTTQVRIQLMIPRPVSRNKPHAAPTATPLVSSPDGSGGQTRGQLSCPSPL